MWNTLASLILRNRLTISFIIIVLTIFFGYFAVTQLKVDNRYGNTLPKDSPVQIDYLKFKEQFGEDGSTLVIAVKSDNLHTERNFKKWLELTKKIRKFKGVENVISEATLFSIINKVDTTNDENSKFVIQEIFNDTTYQSKSIDSIKKEIRLNPIYRDMLYNDDKKVSLMLIGMDEKCLADKKRNKVVFEIEELAIAQNEAFQKTIANQESSNTIQLFFNFILKSYSNTKNFTIFGYFTNFSVWFFFF
jgi:predicted RND superfamily exporter protein